MITEISPRSLPTTVDKSPHASVPKEYSENAHVDLRTCSIEPVRPGTRSGRALWLCASRIFLETRIPWPSNLKAAILRFFGAVIGKGTVIKPRVRIKYPWLLEVEDFCWIGESCWIDNSAAVKIGCHVVLSQGAYLVTGNHDYRSPSFDLRIAEIHIHRGAWIAAKAIVCPGVTVHHHAILCVGSTANQSLDAFGVYAGDPALKKRTRRIKASSRKSRAS